LDGALIMALFGISTIPILFSLGFFVSLLQKNLFRQNMNRVAGVIITLYGLYMFYKGYLFYLPKRRAAIKKGERRIKRRPLEKKY